MPPGVGKTLRDARTQRGLDLSEVERATKIRVKFLAAMEEDHWGDLPAPAYARGFLSSYARFLDLDEAELLDEYRKTTGDEGGAEEIPPQILKPSAAGRRRRRAVFARNRSLKPAGVLVGGLLAIGLLAVVLVAALSGSEDGGGDRGGRQASGADRERRAGGTAEGESADRTTTGESPSTAGTAVAVELRSTAPVWVCLVDGRGRALVNGETLSAGETRGPFDGPLFAVTFGNGSVEMTLDGKPAQVPAVAEPIGYRISASGLRELEPSAQPTCA